MKSPQKSAAILSGESRYFTGTPCKNGHLCERMVSNGGCVLCLRAARDLDNIRKGASLAEVGMDFRELAP